MKNLSDYVKVYDNVLPKSMCEYIIQRFELSDKKEEGIPGTPDGPVDNGWKKDMEIAISSQPEFREIDNLIYEKLSPYTERYISEMNSMFGEEPMLGGKYSDTGYLIKRYDVNDGWFHWHHDSCVEDYGRSYRFAGIIFYLNDVYEGGKTEFSFGTTIAPVTGRLAIFPASWQFMHRGAVPLSNVKYIITSFLHMPSASY